MIGCAGAIAWLVHGWQRQDKPILITNGLLFCIAIYGIISN